MAKLIKLFLGIVLSITVLCAKGQENNIPIDFKKKYLYNLLNELENEFQISFNYETGMINNLSANLPKNYFESKNLNTRLTILEKKFDISFEQISYKYYVIFLKPKIKRRSFFGKSEPQTDPADSLQSVRIEGQVFSLVTGETLAGVAIFAENRNKYTLSDTLGYFKIDLPAGNTGLVFNIFGFKTQKIEVKKSSRLKVELEESKTLNEVVVVGYGVVDRNNLTGAVSSLSPKSISNMQGITSIDKMLQGNIPGVFVMASSGRPGAPISVKIRGTGTINSTDPLYILDGVPIVNDIDENLNGLNAINPEDIESVEILKDAAATAIYGARSANGVIIINTKRGKSLGRKIEFSTYFGFSKITRKLNLMNSTEYVDFTKSMYQNSGSIAISDNFNNPKVSLVNTDWQDEISQTAFHQSYYLSLSQGKEKFNHFFSFGYLNQEGTLKSTDLKRYSVKSNCDWRISPKFKVGESINVSKILQNTGINETDKIAFRLASSASPLMPVYNPENPQEFAGPTSEVNGINEYTNILGELLLKDNSLQVFRILANIYAEYRILKDFTYRFNLGGDYSSNDERNYTPIYKMGSRSNNQDRLANLEVDKKVWVLENIFRYGFKILKHNFDFTLLHSAESYHAKDNSYSIIKYPDPKIPDILITTETSSKGKQEWKVLSYLGRINYNFMNKYFITGSMRIDGSSRFGSSRFGQFPAIAVAWRINQEDFIKRVKWISDLKLRFSYGVSGNQDIGNYGYITVLTSEKYSMYSFGTPAHLVGGTVPLLSSGNTNIKWETSKQFNYAIDLGLFKDMLIMSVDYFRKKNEDILIKVPVSYLSGLLPHAYPYMNVGKIFNEGLEFAFLFRQKVNSRFSYHIASNFSWLYNEVIDLGKADFIYGGEIKGQYVTKTDENHPVGAFYGYIAEGIFQSEDEIKKSPEQEHARPGDIKFKDLNNDNQITELDKTFMGSSIPKFLYGINLDIVYRSFELNVFIQGIKGMDIYDAHRRVIGLPSNITEEAEKDPNKLREVAWYWTAENPSTTMPRASVTDPNKNSRHSSWWIEDGSYLRIKNIHIAYNFKMKTLSKVHISKLRVYFSAMNPFTLTKYKGYDPEVGSQQQIVSGDRPTLSNGIDYGIYPQSASYMLGLQFSF